MTHRKQSIIVLLYNITMISVVCLFLTACSSKNKTSPASEEKHSINHYRDSLSTIEFEYDGTEDSNWLQTIQKTALVMSDNHFTYNRKGIKNTLDKALDGNKHGDCAHLISWSLQECGILDKGEHFYSNSKGSLSCSKDSSTYSHLKKSCDIIETGGISCSDTEELKDILHIGDICCYNKHMNVVAGINKNGDILYYDAGLVPTKRKSGKIYYTEKLSRPFPRKTLTFKKYKLYTIIRIKEDVQTKNR